MSDHVIETTYLRKSYGGEDVVSGLCLSVSHGSVYGFLGRNGAGKTTSIKMLLGIVHPTSGEGMVFGKRIDNRNESVEIRKRTAFVPEDKRLYDYMTVAQIIRFTRSFYPAWRSDLEKTYLRRFELDLSKKVKILSKGMRTKLALLLSLCRGADLLILDEPTEGLDPAISAR